MFRSIYLKMLITYLLVLILTLAGSVLLMVRMYASDAEDATWETMRNEAAQVNRQLTDVLSGRMHNETMRATLTYIVGESHHSIWVVDQYGGVFLQVAVNWAMIDENASIPPLTINEADLSNILQGEEVVMQGSFENRFSESMMTLGTPWTLNDMIVGAIYIHARPPAVQDATRRVIQQQLWSMLISALCAMLVLGFVTRQMTRPLVAMNRAVRDFGHGKFDEPPKVKGRDEVAQLAQGLNAMANDLKGLETMRRDFVANVSHELRSPLTSMQGFLQGIQDGVIPVEEQERYIELVLSETRRLNRLINDLLDMSRMETGQMKLDCQPFELNELIRRTVITFEGKIEQKSIELQLQLEDAKWVWGDSERIGQVISNLLDNAIKFTPEQGVIEMWTYEGRDVVFTSIRDSGSGIPPEDAAYVFERFFKSDRARSPQNMENSKSLNRGGTGLGLHIAKSILDQHEQEIQLVSAPGKGAQFIFSLKKTASPRRIEGSNM